MKPGIASFAVSSVNRPVRYRKSVRANSQVNGKAKMNIQKTVPRPRTAVLPVTLASLFWVSNSA